LHQADEPLEQALRIRPASDQDIGVREPEATGQEGAFAGRQPIPRRGGVVPKHEPAAQELSLDGLDRALDAHIVGRQEADLRDQQRARVQQVAVVRLDKRPETRVECPPADLLVDLSMDPPSPVHRAVEPERLHRLDGPVKRHPRHHL
jgi:hypothetical protein